jgi:SEC-C motif
MKVGRNDPCPCGSGKKYKKCCMDKNVAAERAALPVEITTPAVSPPIDWAPPPRPELPPRLEPNPQDQAMQARLDAFESANYEARIALFLQTLDEPELIDREMAFEMLNPLYGECAARNQRARFDELVAGLRERWPDLYAEDAHYYLDWLIANALAEGRTEQLPALARELAATAGDDLDIFNSAIDRLAYHGQLDVLLEAIRIAWPHVQQSDVFEWAINEFAGKATDFVALDYLEHTSLPDAGDPELLDRLSYFLPPDPQHLARYLTYVSGRTERDWTQTTFTVERPARRGYDDDHEVTPGDDQGALNLHLLGLEFLGYLRREQQVPYTRGNLARALIEQYLVKRQPKQSPRRLSKAATIRAAKAAQASAAASHHDHAQLQPTRATLDPFLADQLYFLNPQHYDVAAALELLPAWLRFLESRRLIDAQQRAAALDDLRILVDQATPIWQRLNDPMLGPDIERAWASQATDTLQ